MKYMLMMNCPRDGYDQPFAMRAEETARELARWENEGARI